MAEEMIVEDGCNSELEIEADDEMRLDGTVVCNILGLDAGGKVDVVDAEDITIDVGVRADVLGNEESGNEERRLISSSSYNDAALGKARGSDGATELAEDDKRMLLGVRISDTSTLRGRGLSEAEIEGDIDISDKGREGKAGLSSCWATMGDGESETIDAEERCVLAPAGAGDLGGATDDVLASDAVLDPLVCGIGDAGAGTEGALASDGVLDPRVWGIGDAELVTEDALTSEGALDPRVWGIGEGGAAMDSALASDGVLDAQVWNTGEGGAAIDDTLMIEGVLDALVGVLSSSLTDRAVGVLASEGVLIGGGVSILGGGSYVGSSTYSSLSSSIASYTVSSTGSYAGCLIDVGGVTGT